MIMIMVVGIVVKVSVVSCVVFVRMCRFIEVLVIVMFEIDLLLYWRMVVVMLLVLLYGSVVG